MFDKIKSAYWSIVPHHLRPGNLWYSFTGWLWHRYSTVRPRGRDGKKLPHTWVDRCHLMPCMIFEILSDFVVKECGEDTHVEWYGDEPHMVEVAGEQVNVRDELQDLYDWWHNDYTKNIENTHVEWHAHTREHVKNWFTSLSDKGDRDFSGWVRAIDSEEFDEEYGEEFGEDETLYSSHEAEAENRRIFLECIEREDGYEKELNSRLHRVINVIPYMWT